MVHGYAELEQSEFVGKWEAQFGQKPHPHHRQLQIIENPKNWNYGEGNSFRATTPPPRPNSKFKIHKTVIIGVG